VQNLVEYAMVPLTSCLQDKSPYVRKTAALGCVKLFYVNREAIEDHGIPETLYAMLQDRDAQVVANCVIALEEVLAAEGGLLLTKDVVVRLMNRLTEFTEWNQCIIMGVVARYQPADEVRCTGRGCSSMPLPACAPCAALHLLPVHPPRHACMRPRSPSWWYPTSRARTAKQRAAPPARPPARSPGLAGWLACWLACWLANRLFARPPQDECFDILNILDDRLKHSNTGVLLAAAKLFLHFTRDMPEVQADVFQRLKGKWACG